MSDSSSESDNLDGLLDDIEDAAKDHERVCVDDVMKAVEERSFGALLVVPGLISATPIGGIPGVPTAMGVILVLITGQILLGLQSFWLPRFIRERSVPSDKLKKSMRFLRPVARVVDKILRPRLTVLTRRPATYVIAAACLILGLIKPPLELVPFGVMVPSIAVIAFGLALVARDGLIALFAFIVSAISLYLVVSNLIL